MRRREFITLLGGAAAWPLAAPAQQGERARRIGFLRAAPPPEHELDAFLPALAERGYVQGRNFVLVPQWGDGNVARLSELAVTLVNQGVDVIVTEGTIVVRAAAAVTASIPIVTAIRRRPFFWWFDKEHLASGRKRHGICQHGKGYLQQGLWHT